MTVEPERAPQIELLKLITQFSDLKRRLRETADISNRLALLEEIGGVLDLIGINLDRQATEDCSLSGLDPPKRRGKLYAGNR
jgi:hypothetical protein